jgi:hypothetical protein
MKEAKNKITQIYNRYRSRNGATGSPLSKKTSKEEYADGAINDMTKEINGVIEESSRRLNDEEKQELTDYATSSIDRFSGITKKGL